MTCLFTVFGPGQPVFKNDDSNMIEKKKENNVFIVALDFLTAFFIVNSLQYYIILS